MLARADDFADELAGGPLAARFQGPLLLTPTAGLTEHRAARNPAGARRRPHGLLARRHRRDLRDVGTDLQTLGYNPVRVDGADRYDTAVKIANILGDPPTVFEVDGTNFPDGLSAGPAAALSHGAILLTAGHAPAPETAQYLATHPTDVRYAIGGPAAAADPTAQPLVGADRYATSIVVANQLFASPSIVAIASGVAFPDALSGGALAGIDGAPMLLVPSNVPLPASMRSYFDRYSNTVLSAWLFGGTAAVSTPVAKGDRTGTRPGAVRVVAVTGRSIAGAAHGDDRGQCEQGSHPAGRGLWHPLHHRRNLRESRRGCACTALRRRTQPSRQL